MGIAWIISSEGSFGVAYMSLVVYAGIVYVIRYDEF